MPTDKQLSTLIVHQIPTQEMYEALKDARQIGSDDICWVENPTSKVEAELANKSASKPKVSSVALSVSSWTDNGDGTFAQTVTISNGTSNSKVELQPDNTAIMQMINDGVVSLRIDNDNGTFTAVAIKAKPTTDLTIQITLTEVE